MKEFSLPRRIWRIVYPVLIFIAIQFVAIFLVSVFLAAALMVRDIISGAAAIDEAAVTEAITMFLTEHSVLVLLAANIASFAVFIPMWLITRKQAEPYFNENPMTVVLLIAGFFIGFNIVQMIIFGLTDITRFFPSYEEVSETLTGGSIMMQVVTVGFAAPIAEELLFRGILINRMKWLPVWAAVLVQALMFSLVHMNLFQSLYAFLAGVLLGIAYVKYRSIVAAIAGHIAFNLSSVLLG